MFEYKFDFNDLLTNQRKLITDMLSLEKEQRSLDQQKLQHLDQSLLVDFDSIIYLQYLHPMIIIILQYLNSKLTTYGVELLNISPT